MGGLVLSSGSAEGKSHLSVPQSLSTEWEYVNHHPLNCSTQFLQQLSPLPWCWFLLPSSRWDWKPRLHSRRGPASGPPPTTLATLWTDC